MGLTVSVGQLGGRIHLDEEGTQWLRESFAKVNEVLSENGLPIHSEPEHLPLLQSRAIDHGLPFSFLHHLRRFYAYVVNDFNWVPIPEGENPADDPILDKEMYMMSSHLLCHSDTEGFYVPIEFDDILIDEKNQGRICGGILGSSYRLMDELVEIAPKLGIQLNNQQLSDAEAEKLNQEAASQAEFWIEKTVWLVLYEAARLSIEYKTAICFS